MSDSRFQSASEPSDSNTKLTWQAPVIEELDFGGTEASYIPGAPIDLGIYTL